MVSGKGRERPLCHQKPLGKAAQEAPKRDSKWQWVREGAMAGTWRALVLAAGLAAMACVAQRQWGFEERVVAQALQLFNSGRQGQPLSRLREVLPAPRSVSVRGAGGRGSLARPHVPG